MRDKAIVILLISLCLSSCTNKPAPDNSSKAYFDIDDYFKKQAEDLSTRNPKIRKTVTKNNLTETKSLSVRNWINELQMFASSDINKPAWKDLYKVSKNDTSTEYIALDNNLKTRKIRVDHTLNGTVKHILILNQVVNNLYSSAEELNYYPDSLYSIRKKQKILLIGNNDYSIKGQLEVPSR